MNSCNPRVAPEKRYAFQMSYRHYLDRASMRGETAVDQMAEDFRIFAANAGAISKDDLEVLGWTPAQIALHASPARLRANRRSQGRAGC